MVGQCREALGLSGTRWRHHPGRARRQSLIQRHLQPSCTVVRIQAFTYNIYNVIQAFFNSHTSLVHKIYNGTELHRHSNPHHSIFTLLSLLTIKAIHHTALACANIIQYSLCLAQPIPLPPSSELSSTLLQFKLPQITTNKVAKRSKPIHVAEMK